MNADLKPMVEQDQVEIFVHEIEGSPFQIIERVEGDKREFFGALGKARFTDVYNHIHDVKYDLERVDWARIWAMIMVGIRNRWEILEAIEEAEREANGRE